MTDSQAIDAIYEFCDELMFDKNMAVLDAFCSTWTIDDLDKTLAVLTVTGPVKSQLPSREVLLRRAKLVYGDDGGLFDGL